MHIRNAKECTSFSDKLLGLLNPRNPRILVIKTHFGIHTFFMKHPIDVMVLNNKKQVVKMVQNLKPYRLFLYPLKYNYVVEMPSGTLSRFQISIGDKIYVE